ncbi:hypothetical protein GGF46_000371 [Coemansia sp. RSA 552]|nr:hypothetical protein GGF46_000371 [Coemansia sp. RSA 552]
MASSNLASFERPAKKPNKSERPAKKAGSSESPVFADDWDLYPKAMRDAANETTDGAVHCVRDPQVTRDAEQSHRTSLEIERQIAKHHPDELLCFYPCAHRHQ